MHPLDTFTAALERANCRPSRGKSRCPAHEDARPSLTFREGDDGRVLFDCKTGCKHEAIIAALSLEWKDLFPEDDRPPTPKPQPRAATLPTEDDLAVWHEDLLGDELTLAGLVKLRGWSREALADLGVGVVSADVVTALVRRRDNLRRLIIPIHDKTGALVNVLLYAPNPRSRGNEPKVLALAGRPRDLFPPPETLEGEPLFLVEGEPDAISMRTVDLPATAIPGVSGWKPEWTERLKGREVIILLDCDNKGRPRAQEAAATLLKARGTVRILDLDPTRSDGYDVGDMLRKANTSALRAGARDYLLSLARQMERKEPFRLRPVSARDFAAAVPPHNPRDDFLGPLLRRGQRVIVGGATGNGKTTLSMQLISCAAYGEQFVKWRGQGDLRCLIVDLEQGQRSIKKRLIEAGLAERNGNVQVVNIPEGLELDRSIEQRAAVEAALEAGRWDVVLLDPAYQLVAEEPDDDTKAKALVRMLDGWRSKYGFCLIVPTHLRKRPTPGQRLTIDDIHGRSISYRNAEVVLGIERVKKGEARLHWWKDRDGDLDVPLSSFWPMTFDRHGGLFQWDASADEEAA